MSMLNDFLLFASSLCYIVITLILINYVFYKIEEKFRWEENTIIWNLILIILLLFFIFILFYGPLVYFGIIGGF